MSESVCTGTKRNGERCKKPPMHGRDVCKQHSGDPDKGRPTVLTEGTHEKLVQLVRTGNYVEAACAATGIGTTTFYHWMERGEADEEAGKATIFRDLRDAIARAQAESEAILLASIRSAGEKDWRANAWLMERRFRDKWAQQTDIRHSGGLRTEHAGHVAVSAADAPMEPTDEDFAKVADVLQQIGALPGESVNGTNGAGHDE